MKSLICLVVLLFSGPVFSKGLKIEVGQAGSKKSKVAFAPIVGVTKIKKQELLNHIAQNLKFSTYFDVLSLKEAGGVSSGVLNAEQAKKIYQSGVEFLVTSSASSSGATETVQFKVHYLKDLKQVLNKAYIKSARNWRSISNKFSDDFLFSLTGKKSIFNTKLAVTSDRVGRGWRELYVMDWNGQNIRRRSYHKATTMSPNWSTGGNQVVYSAITIQPRTGVRNANLYIYDFRNNRRSMLSSRPGINSGGAFFPDGRSLIMTLTQGGVPDLFRIGLGGKIIDRFTKGPGRTMNVEPSVSPKGKEIAFSSDKSGKPMLYVMDIKNKVPKRLTIAGRYNSAPSWSPDGKTLAFAGWDKGHFEVFTIKTDGTGLKRLTEKRKANGGWSNNESPSFSPDGRFISFISNRTGKKEVFIIRADGSNPTQITKDQHNYFHVKWSPFLRH